MSKPRLLFFDLLRIIAIFSIVALHLYSNAGLLPAYLFPSLNIEMLNLNSHFGNTMVFIIILVSGAVLEYSYGPIVRTVTNAGYYVLFMLKRFCRLYPLYWMSLIIFTILQWNVASVLWQYWPLQYLLSLKDTMNGIAWFVALITCLYFAYPILSRFLNEYGICALFMIFMVSLYMQGIADRAGYFSPFVRVFEFSLGIYIMQIGLYPKWEIRSRAISFLSELTYPVFIVHAVIMSLVWLLGLSGYLLVLAVLSIWLWYLDLQIQSALSKYLPRLEPATHTK